MPGFSYDLHGPAELAPPGPGERERQLAWIRRRQETLAHAEGCGCVAYCRPIADWLAELEPSG